MHGMQIWADKEALFWWRGFSKSIGDISAIDEEVFGGSNGIEDAGAGVIRTIGVGVVEDSNLSPTGRAVTGAACLLASVHLFYGVGPDKVEDGRAAGDSNRVTEHVL